MPAALTQHLEAVTGQRLANVEMDLFETGQGRREVFAAQRQARFGDPDDDGDPGTAIPAGTRRLAAAVAAQAGITVPDASRERMRARAHRDEAMDRVRAHGGHGMPMRRLGDGNGGSTRERAERLRQPVHAARFGETWNGSLPQYTAGDLL